MSACKGHPDLASSQKEKEMMKSIFLIRCQDLLILNSTSQT